MAGVVSLEQALCLTFQGETVTFMALLQGP